MAKISFRKNMLFCRKLISVLLLITFGCMMSAFPSWAQAVLNLPAPGQAVWLTPVFEPPILQGMTVHPENPLLFDFIVARGQDRLDNRLLRGESTRLIKYFFASMTIPDKDAWVNLSPYEKDRIVPDALGQTEMGRQMLEQDYVLKQLSASLTDPDKELGQKFWNEVKARAQKQFGTLDIPLSTFNKVWIVPDGATVVEKGGFVYIIESKLKVMLDEDYQSLSRQGAVGPNAAGSSTAAKLYDVNCLSTEVFREMILPTLIKEVNTGKNFAQTRQVYHSVILAAWYKKVLKDSLLGKIYADKNKIKGVESDIKDVKQKVYEQYLEAFKRGVYNVVKEDEGVDSDGMIPRKYFSGGEVMAVDLTITHSEKNIDRAASAIISAGDNNVIVIAKADGQGLGNPSSLFSKVASVIASAENGNRTNGIFRVNMAKAIIEAVGNIKEMTHEQILSSIVDTRRTIAALTASFDEQQATFYRTLPRSNLIRDVSGVGDFSYTTVSRGNDLMNELYGKVEERLFKNRKFWSDEYNRAYLIGDTQRYYHQLVVKHKDGSIVIYHAYDDVKPAILSWLNTLWNRILNTDGEESYRALAEYEWWFMQVNLYYRGGASIGDAMSMIAQLAKGMPIREKYQRVDFDVLSLPLDEYINFRVLQFNLMLKAQSKWMADSSDAVDLVIRNRSGQSFGRYYQDNSSHMSQRVKDLIQQVLKTDNSKWEERFGQMNIAQMAEEFKGVAADFFPKLSSVNVQLLITRGLAGMLDVLTDNLSVDDQVKQDFSAYSSAEGRYLLQDTLRDLMKDPLDQKRRAKAWLRELFLRSEIRLENGRIVTEVGASSAVEPPAAISDTPVGGIDFDATKLNLQIKRDDSAVPLPLPQQNLDNIDIKGLYPVIINIMPINAQTLPVLGQLNVSSEAVLPKI